MHLLLSRPNKALTILLERKRLYKLSHLVIGCDHYNHHVLLRVKNGWAISVQDWLHSLTVNPFIVACAINEECGYG
jgi:arginine repressor